jgi:putative Ca2+/H+ antiporter (TMEM165/GDT1 family)
VIQEAQVRMIAILFATYGAVFVAEIAGDKLLYTTGVLAARYRTTPIMCGMVIAFMGKMAAAVMIGTAITSLPRFAIVIVTSISFLSVAIALWRKSAVQIESPEDHPASKAVIVSFTAIFFSEWADVGQVTAATMAARFGSPFLVWIGAVCAMVTKGALAASVGAGIRERVRQHLSPKLLRVGSVALLLFIGFLSVLEALTENH